jgi:hypothetical protein
VQEKHPGASAFGVAAHREGVLQGEFPQFAVIRAFSVPFWKLIDGGTG